MSLSIEQNGHDGYGKDAFWALHLTVQVVTPVVIPILQEYHKFLVHLAGDGIIGIVHNECPCQTVCALCRGVTINARERIENIFPMQENDANKYLWYHIVPALTIVKL